MAQVYSIKQLDNQKITKNLWDNVVDIWNKATDGLDQPTDSVNIQEENDLVVLFENMFSGNKSKILVSINKVLQFLTRLKK